MKKNEHISAVLFCLLALALLPETGNSEHVIDGLMRLPEEQKKAAAVKELDKKYSVRGICLLEQENGMDAPCPQLNLVVEKTVQETILVQTQADGTFFVRLSDSQPHRLWPQSKHYFLKPDGTFIIRGGDHPTIRLILK